jgi:hypothetical protein
LFHSLSLVGVVGLVVEHQGGGAAGGDAVVEVGHVEGLRGRAWAEHGGERGRLVGGGRGGALV